jgi:type I restriction enzyme S subunit
MIEGLKPYVDYKESGLPWLGRCPRHWSLRRTKILFRERVQKGFPQEPMLAATQNKGVVRKEDYGNRTVTAQKDFHLLKLVEPGDYVISLRSFQGGIEYAHHRGIISPAYTILKPTRSAQSGYYTHFFKSRSFIDSLTLFVIGIREGQNIDYDRLSRAEMPCPPDDEQAAIVRFLDHANRKIDGFIRSKRKLIGLLNEQKQAIIHRAVTRGLDPNVSLKPSGIPWLGDIPQHWEVQRARFLFCPVTRRDIRKDDQKMSVTQRNGLIPTDEMLENSTQAESFDRFQVCHPQDLVLNKYKAHLGVFCCAFQRGLITPNYTVFRPIRKLHTHFFDILFHTATYRNEFSKRVHGVTEGMSPLYTQDFNQVPVIFPPYEEQVAIIGEIGNLAKPQNTAVARTEREIALMQEYRTRLTADVVTGKLDVRAAAASLPAIDELAPATPGTDGDDLDHGEDADA